MENRKIWFKAKNYGWGWYPSTWQGWMIILVWVLLNLSMFYGIENRANSLEETLINFLLPLFLSIILLIFACWGAGERPRWRWGGK